MPLWPKEVTNSQDLLNLGKSRQPPAGKYLDFKILILRGVRCVWTFLEAGGKRLGVVRDVVEGDSPHKAPEALAAWS